MPAALRLYEAERKLWPGHTIYGWGPVDDFGQVILSSLSQVKHYAFSSSHDQFALRHYQLPDYYRLRGHAWGGDAPGLYGRSGV